MAGNKNTALAGNDLPDIPASWQWCRLGDLVDPERGICYGIVQPGRHHENGIPMVNSQDVLDGRVSSNVEFRVARDLHARFKRSTLRGGEILLTLVGANFGRVAIAPKSYSGFNCSRAVGVISVREHAEYVMFCLRSPVTRRFLDNWANTTAQPTFNLKDVGNLPIPLPPPGEQRRIAHILGTLDEKIELNRRMNATLEAMAGTLFHSWFVDFDPLGNNSGSGKTLPEEAFFPETCEDSEMGEIPKGWRVGSIYELADVIYGAPFASKLFNSDREGKPLIRIRDLKNESPGVWTPETHPKGYLVKPGDIVVGMDGEFRAYLWGGEEGWLNQRVCVFAPKPGYSAAFIRNSIMAPLQQVEATETATTVIHLGKNDIDRFKVIIPSTNVLAAFSKICQPWYDQIVANKQQSRSLATLRDALLPKLLSGQHK